MADAPPPPHVTVILPPQTSAQTATNFIMTNDAYISRPGSTINGYVNVFPFSSIPAGDTQSNEEDNSDDAIPPPKADFSAPPPYEVVTSSKLPSYEEVQHEKRIHGEEDAHTGLPPVNQAPPFAYLTVEPTDSTTDINDPESNLLGTDFMFFTAFFVAFMFNWIGFLLLMCFCHTIASRYGALSGFGLSLAKWTLIVKHSTELASHENSWLWWLIMAFGVLICIRAIVQYLNIKRGWRLLSGTAQERLLFFY